MLTHLLWFLLSITVSFAVIACADSTHSYFITLLTKPIEKTIAENVTRDLLLQQPPAAYNARDEGCTEISDPITYDPNQFSEIKSELQEFLNDTTDISAL